MSTDPHLAEFRDEHGKHRFEDAAMKIVEAIHRDIAPNIDDNDGGEILSWILQLSEQSFAAGVQQERAGCVSCGEVNDGGYETEEVGTFCSQCWGHLQEHFTQQERERFSKLLVMVLGYLEAHANNIKQEFGCGDENVRACINKIEAAIRADVAEEQG